MEVKKKLQEKTGTTILTTAFALILGVLFLLLISEYLFLYGTVHRLTDQMQQTVIKTATNNYYNVYAGIREGNSSAHEYAGSGAWNAVVSTEDIIVGLKDTLSLAEQGNTLNKKSPDNRLIYSLENIQSYVTNVAVGTGSADTKLTFHTTATAKIPIRILGLSIVVQKQISIDSQYIPRF